VHTSFALCRLDIGGSGGCVPPDASTTSNSIDGCRCPTTDAMASARHGLPMLRTMTVAVGPALTLSNALAFRLIRRIGL
jgi:hypothetical protein